MAGGHARADHDQVGVLGQPGQLARRGSLHQLDAELGGPAPNGVVGAVVHGHHGLALGQHLPGHGRAGDGQPDDEHPLSHQSM